MPFRERAKALFKTRSRGDSLSKTSSKDSSSTTTQNGGRERWPSNVYKPGEAMPRPKYRRPPEKAHKEKLDAFSFGDAWRRKSYQSTYSPMGTRAPSRRNSFLGGGSRRHSFLSVGKKSRMSSRQGSVKSVKSGTTEESGVAGPPPTMGGRQREGLMMGAAVPTRLSTEQEAEGDDDVTNVGLSRVQSHEHHPTVLSRQRTAEDIPPLRAMNTAHDHQPFTEQDLALALQRTHLAVPTQG